MKLHRSDRIHYSVKCKSPPKPNICRSATMFAELTTCEFVYACSSSLTNILNHLNLKCKPGMTVVNYYFTIARDYKETVNCDKKGAEHNEN